MIRCRPVPGLRDSYSYFVPFFWVPASVFSGVSYFLLPSLLLVTAAEYILHLSATGSSCGEEMRDAEKRESRRLMDGAVLYL